MTDDERQTLVEVNYMQTRRKYRMRDIAGFKHNVFLGLTALAAVVSAIASVSAALHH